MVRETQKTAMGRVGANLDFSNFAAAYLFTAG